jgi:hypothetical protein
MAITKYRSALHLQRNGFATLTERTHDIGQIVIVGTLKVDNSDGSSSMATPVLISRTILLRVATFL